VVETSEEILRIRLQHPARLAASDDLDEGRQIMVGASFGLPPNKRDRCQLARRWRGCFAAKQRHRSGRRIQ